MPRRGIPYIRSKTPKRYARLMVRDFLTEMPPIKKRKSTPTRLELDTAAIYEPGVISARIAARMLRENCTTAAIRMRMKRMRDRLGLRAPRRRRTPKFQQLSTVGDI